ncbi:MAG: hypothetical protein NVS3B10_10250 [Polyangiales bacterium]
MLQPKTILTSCLLAAFVVACSSSSDTGGTTGDTGTARGDTGGGGGSDTGSSGSDTGGVKTDTGSSSIDTGSSGTDTGSSGTDTGGSGGDGGTDPTCGATTTQTDCQKCCHDAHVDGYNAFVSALLTCACKPGNCDTACAATVCASTPTSPDAACKTCLGTIQSGACKTDLATACGPGGPCAPFNDCIQSECKGKP